MSLAYKATNLSLCVAAMHHEPTVYYALRRSDLQDLGGGAERFEGKYVRTRCNKEYV